MTSSDSAIRRPGAPDVSEAREQPHLLLAEDDDDLRPMLAEALRARGYRVTAVDDGVGLLAGIQFGRWESAERRVDVIVADLNMPGLSAVEVLEAVRCSGFATPVVLITADDVPRLVARGDVADASAIFQKPVDIDRLDTTVAELLAETALSRDERSAVAVR